MSVFLFHNEEEACDKISIDELFEKRRIQDIKQLSTFNKILNRVHKKIKDVSKKRTDKHVWFVVPGFIFGDPIYSNTDCIAFIISKLTLNGFFVRFIDPNMLFISWENYIPAYVRSEFKKKTGKIINENGVVVETPNEDGNNAEQPNSDADTHTQRSSTKECSKTYTPIKQYRPTGKLIYNQDIFEKIEKRIS
jgi:hypothetical protein